MAPIYQNNVIDMTSKVLKRWGYCDFFTDGSFDPVTEEVVNKYWDFDDKYYYTWDPGPEIFIQGGLKPVVPHSLVALYAQDEEPALCDENIAAIWTDTSATPNLVWFVFMRADGMQCLVELTPRTWTTCFAEDFEDPGWRGEWGSTASDFVEDFEEPAWAGVWTGTSSDFVEDFQSWPLGPI